MSGNVTFNGQTIDLSSVPDAPVDTTDLPLATGDLVITDMPQGLFDNMNFGDGVIITKGKDNSVGFTCPAGFTNGDRPTGTYTWNGTNPVPGSTSSVTWTNNTGTKIDPAQGVITARSDGFGSNNYKASTVLNGEALNDVIAWNKDTIGTSLSYQCVSDQLT